MDVYLVDGTYELFRHYLSPAYKGDRRGREDPAYRRVVASILRMARDGVTHVGVATDHVIESFRNELWPGYKTSAGVPADLLEQFEPLEDALREAGITVWAMIEYEADDALAAAAAKAADDSRVGRVVICTPDKDLAQCVRNDRVVQLIRRTDEIRNEAGVIEKFGVSPDSIPDYLALVGDSADGYPGLPGWGAKSAATVLARFKRIEDIPADWTAWGVNVGRAGALSATLEELREAAMLFKDLATLRTDVPVFATVDELEWKGRGGR